MKEQGGQSTRDALPPSTLEPHATMSPSWEGLDELQAAPDVVFRV